MSKSTMPSWSRWAAMNPAVSRAAERAITIFGTPPARSIMLPE